MSYLERLQELDGEPTVERGSEDEEAAVARFREFFSVLSAENVRSKIDGVYAGDVWFNDTLKTVRGVDALREYFVESAEAVHECRVEMTDWARSGGSYYFRWTMMIRFKKLRGGEPTGSIGMSHIRFDSRGRVVLHQDYWDSASGLFEHVPLLGGAIRMIKRRL